MTTAADTSSLFDVLAQWTTVWDQEQEMDRVMDVDRPDMLQTTSSPAVSTKTPTQEGDVSITGRRVATRHSLRNKQRNANSDPTHAPLMIDTATTKKTIDHRQEKAQPPRSSHESLESTSLSLTSHIGFDVKDSHNTPNQFPIHQGSTASPTATHTTMTPITVPQQYGPFSVSSSRGSKGSGDETGFPLFSPGDGQTLTVEDLLKDVSPPSPLPLTETFLSASGMSSCIDSVQVNPGGPNDTAVTQVPPTTGASSIPKHGSSPYASTSLLYSQQQDQESFPFKRLDMIPTAFLEQLGCSSSESNEATSTETLAILPSYLPNQTTIICDEEGAETCSIEAQQMKDDMERVQSFMSLLDGTSHAWSMVDETNGTTPTSQGVQPNPASTANDDMDTTLSLTKQYKTSSSMHSSDHGIEEDKEVVLNGRVDPKKPDTIEKELLDTMVQTSFGPTLTSPLLLSLSMPTTLTENPFKLPTAMMPNYYPGGGNLASQQTFQSMNMPTMMPMPLPYSMGGNLTKFGSVGEKGGMLPIQPQRMTSRQPKPIMAQLSATPSTRFSPYARCTVPKCLPNLPKRQQSPAPVRPNLMPPVPNAAFPSWPPMPSFMTLDTANCMDTPAPLWLSPDFMSEPAATNTTSGLKGHSMTATTMNGMFVANGVSNAGSTAITGFNMAHNATSSASDAAMAKSGKKHGQGSTEQGVSPTAPMVPTADLLQQHSFGHLNSKQQPPTSTKIVSPEHVVAMPQVMYAMSPEGSNYTIVPGTTTQGSRLLATPSPTGATFMNANGIPLTPQQQQHKASQGITVKPHSKKGKPNATMNAASASRSAKSHASHALLTLSGMHDRDHATAVVPQNTPSSAKQQPRRVSTSTLELLRQNLLKRKKSGDSSESLSESKETDAPSSPSKVPSKSTTATSTTAKASPSAPGVMEAPKSTRKGKTT